MIRLSDYEAKVNGALAAGKAEEGTVTGPGVAYVKTISAAAGLKPHLPSLGKRRILPEVGRLIEAAVANSSSDCVTVVLSTDRISRQCSASQRATRAVLATLAAVGVIEPAGPSIYRVAYRTADGGVFRPFVASQHILGVLPITVSPSPAGRITDTIAQMAVQAEVLAVMGQPQTRELKRLSRRLRDSLAGNLRTLVLGLQYTTKVQKCEALPVILRKISDYDQAFPGLSEAVSKLFEKQGLAQGLPISTDQWRKLPMTSEAGGDVAEIQNGWDQNCRSGPDHLLPNKVLLLLKEDKKRSSRSEPERQFGLELQSFQPLTEGTSDEGKCRERQPQPEAQLFESDRPVKAKLKSGLRQSREMRRTPEEIAEARANLTIIANTYRAVHPRHRFRWSWDRCPSNLRKLLYRIPVWKERDPNPDVPKIFLGAFSYYSLTHYGRGPAQAYLGNAEFDDILFKMRTASIVMQGYYREYLPHCEDPAKEEQEWKNWLASATQSSHYCRLPCEPLEVGGPYLREYDEFVLYMGWRSWHRAFCSARDEHNLELTLSLFFSTNMNHIRERQRLTYEDLYGPHSELRAIQALLNSDSRLYVDPDKRKEFGPDLVDLPLKPKKPEGSDQ